MTPIKKLLATGAIAACVVAHNPESLPDAARDCVGVPIVAQTGVLGELFASIHETEEELTDERHERHEAVEHLEDRNREESKAFSYGADKHNQEQE